MPVIPQIIILASLGWQGVEPHLPPPELLHLRFMVVKQPLALLLARRSIQLP
jgi:hypothetical protein